MSTTLFCSFAGWAVQRSYYFKDDSKDKYGQSVKIAAAGSIAVLASEFLFALVSSCTDGAPAADLAAAPIESKA